MKKPLTAALLSAVAVATLAVPAGAAVWWAPDGTPHAPGFAPV